MLYIVLARFKCYVKFFRFMLLDIFVMIYFFVVTFIGWQLQLHVHNMIPFSVSVSRPIEASGPLEVEQRRVIRMQFKSSAENSRSNNPHPERLVSQVSIMSDHLSAY